MSAKQIRKIVEGSFEYDITDSKLTITPYTKEGRLNHKETITLDLALIPDEVLTKIKVD